MKSRVAHTIGASWLGRGRYTLFMADVLALLVPHFPATDVVVIASGERLCRIRTDETTADKSIHFLVNACPAVDLSMEAVLYFDDQRCEEVPRPQIMAKHKDTRTLFADLVPSMRSWTPRRTNITHTDMPLDTNLFDTSWSSDGRYVTLQPPCCSHHIIADTRPREGDKTHQTRQVDGLISGNDIGRPEIKFQLKSVAWSPCGKFLAQGTPTELAIVTFASGRLQKLSEKHGCIGRDRCLAWSPCGQFLGAVHNSACRIWDVRNKVCVKTLICTASCAQLEWSPDGKFLALVGEGSTVWRVKDWKTVGSSIPYLRDMYHLDAARCISWCPYHLDAARCISWSPCSQYLAFTSPYLGLVTWNVHTGKSTWLTGMHGSYIVEWSPNGRYLATVSTYGDISVWDFSRKLCVKELASKALSIKWMPDSQSLMALSKGNILTVWGIHENPSAPMFTGWAANHKKKLKLLK
jgi:WD40 repeat protein